MIFDQLKNACLYFSLSERMKKALEYLGTTNFSTMEPGKIEIDGDDIFAIVQHYDTKPITSGKWESHKKYIDIQYIVSGKEKIGYSHSNKTIVTQPYHAEKDVQYLKGEGNFLIVEAGYFAILFPSDVHMPGIAINLSTPVTKVVIKVKVDSLETEALSNNEEPIENVENNIDEIKPQAEDQQTEKSEEQPSN
jgi:YhcH/YjgK/YiaL family protein